MSTNPDIQPIIDFINAGTLNRILITSGKNTDPDAVGSVMALALGLQTKIAEVVMAIEDFEPGSFTFIQGVDQIQSSIAQKSLVVSIDLASTPISKVNYNAENSKFNLILTPESGQVDPNNINYSYTGLDFEAIFVVDTAKKELLGQWIKDFDQDLNNLPMVNIDHHQDNQNFGSLNLVDPLAASATVVVHQLLQALDIAISPAIASPLLTGLLGDTSGFANSNADAPTLRLAAELVDSGANLHQSMAGLFRNMSFSAIKLWGRVLSSLQKEPAGILIAQLSQDDIQQLQASQADIDSLGSLVNNILVADQSAKVAVLLKDKGEGEITGSMRAIDNTNVASIAQQLGGGGHIKAAGFRLYQTTLEQARVQVLDAIRLQLEKEPR